MMTVLWAIALFAGTASSRCSAPLEVGNNSLWVVVGGAPSQDALTNTGGLCEMGFVGAAPAGGRVAGAALGAAETRLGHGEQTVGAETAVRVVNDVCLRR